VYLLRTSLHRTVLQATIFNFWYFILLTVLTFNQNSNQNSLIFICGVILTHYKYICIFAFTTTWVAATCWWSGCNKIHIYVCGFKTSGDAFRLPYSIAFGCSIRPLLVLFHSWLYISHLSKFFAGSLVFSFRFPVNLSFW